MTWAPALNMYSILPLGCESVNGPSEERLSPPFLRQYDSQVRDDTMFNQLLTWRAVPNLQPV
jgi:hypothetical protein